ncbi:hypothetical protein HJG44_04870 [Enterovirga sp. DB1703]|uniref:Uncharacterized protein n=1 Tax=Enterovirga aerilata TaxID=2730920 RepID=A0A849I6L5_9HYPH|nr:hypothetical protein [Enterovirga sp. DB1703]
MLERHDRTQQLVVRLDQHMDARFQQVEARFAEIRTAIAEIRSDAILQQNRLLARHNEILDVLRRLDAAGMPDEPGDED